MLESIPRKGTIVCPVKEQDAYAQLLIRESLESTAVKIYCGKLVKENYNEFKDFAAIMDNMSAQGKEFTIEHKKMEIRFHASLVNLCQMPIFTREFIRSIRIGVFSNINRIQGDYSERQNHLELLNKLTVDDKDEAVNAIKYHLWSGKPVQPLNQKSTHTLKFFHQSVHTKSPDVCIPLAIAITVAYNAIAKMRITYHPEPNLDSSKKPVFHVHYYDNNFSRTKAEKLSKDLYRKYNKFFKGVNRQ